jgi:hypothetical protein
MENVQKIKALEDERALATRGMTQEQIDAFNKSVEQQQAYSQMTDIEKIKADYSIKRDEINNTMTAEQLAIQTIQDLRINSEKNRLAVYKASKDQQLTWLQELINKQAELARMKG